MCFLIDMVNVSLELKDPKGKESTGSLARYDFHGAGSCLVTDRTGAVLQTALILRLSRGCGTVVHDGGGLHSAFWWLFQSLNSFLYE